MRKLYNSEGPLTNFRNSRSPKNMVLGSSGWGGYPCIGLPVRTMYSATKPHRSVMSGPKQPLWRSLPAHKFVHPQSPNTQQLRLLVQSSVTCLECWNQEPQLLGNTYQHHVEVESVLCTIIGGRITSKLVVEHGDFILAMFVCS